MVAPIYDFASLPNIARYIFTYNLKANKNNHKIFNLFFRNSPFDQSLFCTKQNQYYFVLIELNQFKYNEKAYITFRLRAVFIIIKDKVRKLTEKQMDSTSEIKNKNVYEDYIHALVRQNQQYQIEHQVMEKQITNLSGQLDLFMREKQTNQQQYLRISQLCAQKDQQIQGMQMIMIETAKILKQKNEEILMMDSLLKSQQAKWESQIQKRQKDKKRMLVENKVLTYSIQNQQKRKKQNVICLAYNQVLQCQGFKEENLLSKEQIQKIQTENTQYGVRVQCMLSILKNQQILTAEHTERLESLTLLLQKKEKQIQSMESSNQYLRNLNQSLLNQNIVQISSAKTRRASRRKSKVTFNKELNTTAQDEEIFDFVPQESVKRISTLRVIKASNSESVLKTLRFP